MACGRSTPSCATTCSLKSASIEVSLRDRHATTDAKSPRRYSQAGWRLLPFVFVEIDPSLHPANCFLIESMRDNVARTEVVLNIEAQNFIQHFIRRKGVLVFLIRFELGTRWLVDGRPGNDLAIAIDPARQLVNHGFGNIADDSQPARHVPVDGAITYGQFALVSRGQKQL